MRKYILFITVAGCLASILAFKFSDGEKWKAPAEAKKIINPLKSSGNVLADGKYLYKQNCKSCHGQLGKGDGELSKTLKANCANLTSDEVQAQSDGELYYKLSAGRIEMPGFKDILNAEERWALIHYIRTLDEGPDMTGGY